MLNKLVLITILCFTIHFTTGHVVRQDNVHESFVSGINFDLKDAKFNDNITYYSYHITGTEIHM